MKKESKKLSAIPSVVNLPHGIRLNSIPFRITSWDDAGRPKTFEILEAGTELGPDDCALFASEEWIRRPNPAKAK